MRTFFVSALLVLVPAAALAQGCPYKPGNVTKPVLRGTVQSSDVNFEWISTAEEVGGAWRVTHSVCNMSQSSLILGWEKANIRAGAFTPIVPGIPAVVSHTLPTEPSAEGSPITYHFSAYRADAQTYQAVGKDGKVASLSSSIFGVVGNTYPATSGSAGQQPFDVQTMFDVDKTATGYRFRTIVKNTDSTRLVVAISSSQNERLLSALKSAGVDAANRTLPRDGVPELPPKVVASSGEKEKMYVVFPISAVLTKGAIAVPGTTNDVEVADLLLLDGRLHPVMSGSLSLFK